LPAQAEALTRSGVRDDGVERGGEAGVPVTRNALMLTAASSRSISRFLASCTTQDWTGFCVAPSTGCPGAVPT
jgi:hypothetical protein